MIEIRLVTPGSAVYFPLKDNDFTEQEKESLKSLGFTDGIFDFDEKKECFRAWSTIVTTAKLRKEREARSRRMASFG